MSEILQIWHENRAPLPGETLEIYKAIQDDMRRKVRPKSAIIDPLDTMGGYTGLRTKPTAIPYTTLRRMANVPAVSAIINTRLNQVARFSHRPRFDGDTGFRIALKDKKQQMTKAEEKRAYEIEEFFLKTGFAKNLVRKDNFNQFLRKIVRDTLTLDAMVFEKVPNFKNELAEIWAVDAATIELVVNNPTGEMDWDPPVYVPQTRGGLKVGAKNIAYVQRVNGMVVAEYTEDELAYAVRNPRTDLDFTDFGLSELETLIEIVTGIVNGVKYNTSYFTHSSLPQGVLEIIGRYDDEDLESFKRHWKALTSGAPGKWAVPVMAMEDGQGVKFTPFKNSNKDMEFNQFLEFLFNIACAVYQIDPNEVGFKSWTSSRALQTDNTEAKMEESRDKGFIPLMTFLADTFNSEIVDLIDEEFTFEWVGLHEEDEDRKLEREIKRLQAGMVTVNMIRKEKDEEEIPEEWANAPANPQLLQVYMNEKQIEQQKAQQDLEAQNAERETENGDKEYARQVEMMERQHAQAKELKQMEQEHQLRMAEYQTRQNEKKEALKKSIEDEFRKEGIIIDWDEY